jgi:hypothetical protein
MHLRAHGTDRNALLWRGPGGCGRAWSGYGAAMQMRTRKLIGTIALLAFVTLYFLLAMLITASTLPGRPMLVQILGYMVAGLAWVVPAGWLISWMSRER